MAEFMPREPAVRLPLIELVKARYFKPQEQFKAGYALTKSGFKASRVFIWGNVVKTFEGDPEIGKGFKGVELDDFTECLSVLCFEEKASLLENVREGDVIEVLGKVRKGKKGIFVLGEHVKKISLNRELMHRAVNLVSLKKLPKAKKGKEKEQEKLAKESAASEEKIEERAGEKSVEIEKNIIS